MSQLPLQFRLLFIALGILVFLWLSIEDKNVILVLILAAVICTLAAASFLLRLPPANKAIIWQQLGFGILAGILTIPVALLLIAVKTGYHAHPTPDFSNAQIISLINKWPFWISGGLLIGLGSGLWRYSRSEPVNTPT